MFIILRNCIIFIIIIDGGLWIFIDIFLLHYYLSYC